MTKINWLVVSIIGLIIILFTMIIFIDDEKFVISGYYNCNKYCNESYMGKIECDSWSFHCSVKCEKSNVYINKFDYCTDENGFVEQCTTKECEER